jgi:glycosyltransferase involved in cell wall biosynthesis
MNNLISVIIPCYNASQYIIETITSVLLQKGVDIEIIVINDGSTDDTENKILKIKTPIINYIKQENKGVSIARNLGLKNARGKYVLFFDADDIMAENFIFTRFKYLENNKECDLVCGEVIKFNSDGEFNDYYRGVGEFAIHEILLYNKEVVTCPSNYMVRKDFLIKNNIIFNEKLSSTADRSFLLECAKNGFIKFEKKLSKLHYRVSKNSMSNTLNKKLVIDNEVFYQELQYGNLVPNNIKRIAYIKGYYILFVSYIKIKFPVRAFFYLLKLLKITLRNTNN